MHATVADLITRYGYALLFLLVAIEGVGIPLPGETALVTAAASAALGKMNIALVIAVAAAAALIGDNTGYWIGRKGGVALVRRYGRHVGLNEGKLDRAHGFFERHGSKTVLFARFIALLRSWAAILAGVGCMRYRGFVLFNAIGGLTWAALFGTIGYVFGRDLPHLRHYVGRLSIALLVIAILAAAVVMVRKRSSR